MRFHHNGRSGDQKPLNAEIAENSRGERGENLILLLFVRFVGFLAIFAVQSFSELPVAHPLRALSSLVQKASFCI
jgi:hypothetical protein